MKIRKTKNLIHELNLDESVDLIPGDKVDVSEKYDEADYMIFHQDMKVLE